jgi:hypothetical protein
MRTRSVSDVAQLAGSTFRHGLKRGINLCRVLGPIGATSDGIGRFAID